jgi:hypothetical protein
MVGGGHVFGDRFGPIKFNSMTLPVIDAECEALESFRFRPGECGRTIQAAAEQHDGA